MNHAKTRSFLAALCLAAAGVLAIEGTALPPNGDEKPPPGHLAVIVNKANTLEGLSLEELRAIVKLEKRTWSGSAGEEVGGKDIIVYLRPSDSGEQKCLLDTVYLMTAEELERYWVKRIYQGEIVSAPATRRTGALAVKSVGREKSAVSFVIKEEASDAVRVLKIAGRLPGEDKYPLLVHK